MSAEKFCPNCGARLTADWAFCENCGAALHISAPYRLVPDQQAKGSGKKLWLILAVVAVVLCGCITLAAAGYLTRESWLPKVRELAGISKQAEPTELPQPTDLPKPTKIPETDVPTKAVTAAATKAPVPGVTKTDPAPPTAGFEWKDDFSSQNSGWHKIDDSDGYASYHEGGVFAIAVAQPDLELRSWPDPLEELKKSDATITVSGFKVEGEGWWGLICRYNDNDNFYQLGIDGSSFTAIKRVNGKETTLTKPEWIETNALDPNGYENGMIPVTMRCEGSTIEVKVNGTGVFKTKDTSLSSGELMIYAASYDTVGDVDGYYIKVLFDNFQIFMP